MQLVATHVCFSLSCVAEGPRGLKPGKNKIMPFLCLGCGTDIGLDTPYLHDG